MSPEARRWARRLALAGLVPVLGLGAWLLSLQPAGRIDFLLHHERYEAIVRTMKARPPGDAQHVDTLSFGEISAAAERNASGQYTIALTVFDRGHYGRTGYLFSDAPPVRTAGDPYSDVAAPGSLWMLGKQVAPHWWVIANNID